MEKPTYKKYWEANSSEERQQVVENAFNLIDKLEKQLLIPAVVGSYSQEEIEAAYDKGLEDGYACMPRNL